MYHVVTYHVLNLIHNYLVDVLWRNERRWLSDVKAIVRRYGQSESLDCQYTPPLDIGHENVQDWQNRSTKRKMKLKAAELLEHDQIQQNNGTKNFYISPAMSLFPFFIVHRHFQVHIRKLELIIAIFIHNSLHFFHYFLKENFYVNFVYKVTDWVKPMCSSCNNASPLSYRK